MPYSRACFVPREAVDSVTVVRSRRSVLLTLLAGTSMLLDRPDTAAKRRRQNRRNKNRPNAGLHQHKDNPTGTGLHQHKDNPT